MSEAEHSVMSEFSRMGHLFLDHWKSPRSRWDGTSWTSLKMDGLDGDDEERFQRNEQYIEESNSRKEFLERQRERMKNPQTQKFMEEYWTPMWQHSHTGEDVNVDDVMDGLDIDRDGGDPSDLDDETKEKMKQAEIANAGVNSNSDMYETE